MALKKITQKVNNEIPLNLWLDFEDIFIMEKRKNPGRRLTKKEFFVTIFQRGVRAWINQ
jgi:hypothetical protein